MKKNLEILILIGVPASGKSTWSKDYVRKNEGWVRVSRDDFREMLKSSGVVDNKVENLINELVNSTITNSLLRKMNVIVDNTNLKAKYINQIIEKFKYSADINFRVFDISKEKAIERDSSREKKVGQGVIEKFYDNYKILIGSFDFQPVKKISQRPHILPDFESSKEDAVIFDIDGTLSLMGKRGPFDWNQVYKDDINKIVAEQLEFHKSKGRKILIVTGRDEVCRRETIEWMDLHNIPYDELYMRPKDNYTKDTIIKRNIYQNYIQPNYNVLSVYEDRLQVLEMWAEEGVFSFNVNQGNHIY